MKRLICSGRSIYAQISKTFEKTDVLDSAVLTKSLNPILSIVSLLGLSIFQFASSTAYVNSYGNLINSTVSSLVYAPNGWLQTIAFFILGLSIMASALVLQFKYPVRLNLGAIIIALIGFAFFLLGACPEQFPGNPLIGSIHQWAAIAIVFFFPIAGFLVATNFKTWDHRFLYIYSMVNSTVEVLFVIIGGYFLIMHDAPGLFERVLLWSGQIWLIAICLEFLLSETKLDFQVKSSNSLVAKSTLFSLYGLLLVYGSMVWPLSLSLIK